MFCRQCGKEIEDGSKFCVYCGAGQGDKGTPAKRAEGVVSAPALRCILPEIAIGLKKI